MHTAQKKLALILALGLCLGLAACGGNTAGVSASAAASGASAEPSTLVYGSGDYTSINPIMNEHCEIKKPAV